MLETYRECLRDSFDVPSLMTLLTEIRARKVRVVSLDMAHPSPFASSLAFGYIANFMYDGDAPLAERRAAALALDRDMLADLLGSEELRELLEPRALAAVEDELQCLDPRRHARSTDAVHDLLRRLGDLSSVELALRCEGGAAFVEQTISTLTKERRVVQVRVASEDRWIAAEDAGRYTEALGCRVPPGLPAAFVTFTGPIDLTDPASALGSLLVRYARTHGPFTTTDAAVRLGCRQRSSSRACCVEATPARCCRASSVPMGRGASGAIPTCCGSCVSGRCRCCAKRSSPRRPMHSPLPARLARRRCGGGERRTRSALRSDRAVAGCRSAGVGAGARHPPGPSAPLHAEAARRTHQRWRDRVGRRRVAGARRRQGHALPAGNSGTARPRQRGLRRRGLGQR